MTSRGDIDRRSVDIPPETIEALRRLLPALDARARAAGAAGSVSIASALRLAVERGVEQLAAEIARDNELR